MSQSNAGEGWWWHPLHPHILLAPLCPCPPSPAQGDASTLCPAVPSSPSSVPRGLWGSSRTGLGFQPLWGKHSPGLGGGDFIVQKSPKGLPSSSISPEITWAQLWCPCGVRHGAQEGTACLDWSVAPLSPSPRFLFHPSCSCHRFHFSPISPGLLLFPVPFSSSLPLLLGFPAGSQDFRALDPDTFGGSWQPLIFAGCPQPPQPPWGVCHSLAPSRAAPLPTSLLPGLCNPKRPLCPLSKPQKQAKPTQLLKGLLAVLSQHVLLGCTELGQLRGLRGSRAAHPGSFSSSSWLLFMGLCLAFILIPPRKSSWKSTCRLSHPLQVTVVSPGELPGTPGAAQLHPSLAQTLGFRRESPWAAKHLCVLSPSPQTLGC